MKSVLIIGLGRFGHHLCKNMAELGNEVMIIDSDEKAVEDLAPIATSVLIGDCTNPEVLKISVWETMIYALYVSVQTSRAVLRLQAT